MYIVLKKSVSLHHKTKGKNMETLNEKIRKSVKNANVRLYSEGETDNVEYLIFEDKERDCYFITSKNGIWAIKRQMHDYFTFYEIIKAMTEKGE